MTLAMALRAYDGLVLATDSRATGGPQQSVDTSEKFLQVNRDIGVMTYGLAVPGYTGISRLVETVKGRREELTYFKPIADAAGGAFQAAHADWLTSEQQQGRATPPDLKVGFILGGYDSAANQFKISHWESPDFQERQYPQDYLMAAQWHIARLLLNKLFYPEIAVEQLSELAVFLLVETAVSEPTVGGPLQLATVTLSQGFQRLHEQDINEILRRNQKRFCRFRQLLLETFSSDNARLVEDLDCRASQLRTE
jgi:20S proteasome alpha/beta subunit